METGSYAVMFTDIKGFTERTSRQTRAENERLLRLHDALLMPVVAGFGGRRVKTIGDAYLCVFDSSTRALACGAAMQDRLAAYNDGVGEGERIHVRVAVNAGEVRVEAGDVFGEAVNIASRVEGVAEAGEVAFTEAALLLADRAYLDYEDLGPHELKGIPEPVKIYRLRRGAEASLPYGGTALASLRLPPPTAERLAKYRPPLSPGVRRALAVVPLAALAIAAVVVALSSLGGRHEIEALADDGKTKEARAKLAALEAEGAGRAELDYLEGVILLAEGSSRGAFQRFEDAAEADPSLAEDRIAPRLEDLLGDARCENRARAARLLGAVEGEDARAALEALAAKEPPSGGGVLGKLMGGCNAGDAAREALERLGAK